MTGEPEFQIHGGPVRAGDEEHSEGAGGERETPGLGGRLLQTRDPHQQPVEQYPGHSPAVRSQQGHLQKLYDWSI